jgi:LysR family transcriptional regulator, hydrogen peroxide-inducible genes activator
VGERIVAQAQQVLREVNQMVRIAEADKDPFGGDFRLGLIPTVAPFLLPKILTPIRKAFPKLKIQLTEAQTSVITRMLREGDLDAVILALPVEEEHLHHLHQEHLYSEPFYFAVSKNHPKAGRKWVRLEDLDHEEVLLLEDGHCLRDQALAICSSRSTIENTNFRATSIETLRQMVAANAGITLMPELAITNRNGAVRYLPFKDEDPHRDIGICWRTSSTRSDLLRQFAEVLKSTMASK